MKKNQLNQTALHSKNKEVTNLFRGYSFRLIPTKQQEEYFWKAANAARWAYNWALAEKQKAYEESGVGLNGYELNKIMTQLKKQPEYQWLNEVGCLAITQSIYDCAEAFKNMLRGISRYPKFKSKKNATPSFCIDTTIKNRGTFLRFDGSKVNKYYPMIKFFHNNTVQLSSIGKVRLSKDAEPFHLWYLTEHNITVYNGRIKYDGEHWNLHFSLDITFKEKPLTNEIIGIDVGAKDTAICSNGETYKNINKTFTHIKKLEKRKKHYQRQISRKYEMNKKFNPDTGKFRYTKTNNIEKLEKKTARIDKTLSNIRKTYNHQISREIVNRHPKMIVMENLNIKGMMKNRHLSKAIQQQNLYQLKCFIQYKAENQGTQFVEVPRNYKSTQICSNCGAVHPMNLKQRTYICESCGHIEDRDLNSAHNLQNYGLNLLQAQPII